MTLLPSRTRQNLPGPRLRSEGRLQCSRPGEQEAAEPAVAALGEAGVLQRDVGRTPAHGVHPTGSRPGQDCARQPGGHPESPGKPWGS